MRPAIFTLTSTCVASMVPVTLTPGVGSVPRNLPP
jgi:hypothetical protein